MPNSVNSPDSSCAPTVLEPVREKSSGACPLPNVSLSEWDRHRPWLYPAGTFWNQRLLKWTSALSSQSTMSSSLSDAPNVPCRTEIFRTVWSARLQSPPPLRSDSSRPGHGPPWAGQQPLLTPAIKLKSYSPILRLWSVQSIAPWPLMQLWPQHMFGAPRIKQTSLRPRPTACWFTCVRCRSPCMAAMHTHHAVPTSEGGPWAGKEEGRKDWTLLTPSCVHHSSIQTNPTPIPPFSQSLQSTYIMLHMPKSAYWLQEALGSESKINENLIAWASYTTKRVTTTFYTEESIFLARRAVLSGKTLKRM